MEELVLQVTGVNEMLTVKCIGITTVAGFMAEVGDIKRFCSPQPNTKVSSPKPN